MNKLPDHLYSTCSQAICKNKNCEQAVKQRGSSGRWYITIWHAGFNTPANNGDGYASEKSAQATWIRCSRGNLV